MWVDGIVTTTFLSFAQVMNNYRNTNILTTRTLVKTPSYNLMGSSALGQAYDQEAVLDLGIGLVEQRVVEWCGLL
jgi:hypothetical protein